ncbi:hypothetical protein V6Z11_D13G030700 [Gossypium hirsutum]
MLKSTKSWKTGGLYLYVFVNGLPFHMVWEIQRYPLPKRRGRGNNLKVPRDIKT